MTVSNSGIVQVFTAPTCATILETKPKTVFGANPSICYVRRNIGNKGANSFILFSNKLPEGATLISATLTLTAATNWGPSFNITIFEMLKKWSASTMNWSNQPGVTGITKSSTLPSGITKGTKVDFDVTPIYANYLVDSKSYGFKIFTGTPNNTTYRNFYGSGTNRPTLTVVYTMPIDKPLSLSPGSFDYTDPALITAPKPTYSAVFDPNTATSMINEVQVQVTSNFSGDTPTFASPLWDSGWVVSSKPELDSSTISGAPTLTPGTTYGWRIRFKSNQGMESPWSDPVVLKRAANPTVSINSTGLPAEYGNLATNPSFETVADTTTASDILLMSNKSTNPSFELTYDTNISKPGGGTAKDVLRQKGGGPVTGIGGAVVYRDNFTNISSTVRWPLKGIYSLCVDATTASANTSSALLSGASTGNPALWNVVSGNTYTVSAYFYQDTIQTGTLNSFARSIKINITAPSVNGGAAMEGWKVAQAQNIVGIQRVSVTFTLPASTSAFNIELTNGATSGKVWWDGFMIDENKKLNQWFDKDTVMSSNDGGDDGYPDYRVADLGASGAGVFVKRVIRSGGGVAITGDTGVVYRSTSNPSMASKYSLVINPKGAVSNTTNAHLSGGSDSGSLTRLGIVPGNEYTFSADLFVPEAQSGSLHSDARKLRVTAYTPTGNVVSLSNQGGVSGLSRVSVTTTIPSNTTGVVVSLYNGAPDYDPDTGLGGQIVLWDNVRITKSPSSEYVDGNYLGFSWSGVEHGSNTTVNAVVKNSTPEFFWAVSDGSQDYREVLVIDPSLPEDNNIIWTSGRQDTDDLSIGIPEGVITKVGKVYRLVVRVEDSDRRIPTYSGGVYYPEYAEDSVDFIYTLDSSVAGISTITTDMNNPVHAEITWTTDSEPDFFEISRNGVVIKTNMIPEDYKIGDRKYRYIDRRTQTNQINTWEVRSIVNEVTSAQNKYTSRKTSTTLLWLYTEGSDAVTTTPPDFLGDYVLPPGHSGGAPFTAPAPTTTPAVSPKLIPIAGETPADFTLYEKGATFEPLNSSNPVRIVEALGGYRGKVNGVLCGECLNDGTTSQDLQTRLLEIRENVGSIYTLHLENITIPVIVYNINTYPLYGARFGKSYGVEFEFFEVVENA